MSEGRGIRIRQQWKKDTNLLAGVVVHMHLDDGCDCIPGSPYVVIFPAHRTEFVSKSLQGDEVSTAVSLGHQISLRLTKDDSAHRVASVSR